MNAFLEGFRHAWVLVFLVVPAGLLVWTWRRRGRALVLPLDHARSKDGRTLAFVLRLCESLPAGLLAIAIALLAAALWVALGAKPSERQRTAGTLVLGVVLALAYERTGRISVPIIAHGLFNLNSAIMILAGVPSS